MAYSDIVNDDTMISPTIIVYYKYKGDFFNILENDNLFHFYYSLKRENNLLDTISIRASSRLLISPPFSPPKSIAFIPSGAKTQKIKRIDDIFTFVIVYSFYFRLFSPNESNSYPLTFDWLLVIVRLLIRLTEVSGMNHMKYEILI